MSNLSIDEQRRRAKVFWDNISDIDYDEFCKLMASYWTKEKRLEKSKQMKDFYLDDSNVEKKRYETLRVWESRDENFRDNFRKKMNTINKSEEKRKDAGLKIKKLWTSEDYLNKMRNRKLRGGNKLKLIDTLNQELIFETMRDFERYFGFSCHLIRKYKDTGLPISIKHLDESNKNLEGCKIESING